MRFALVAVLFAAFAACSDDEPTPAKTNQTNTGGADASTSADGSSTSPPTATGDGGSGPCEKRTVSNREFCVHVPAGGTGPLPVVLSLHGYSSSGQEQAAYFDLDTLAEQKKFILVKPDGTPDRLGLKYWNAFEACCSMFASGTKPDDVDYLTKVIEDVKAAFPVDAKRVYVVGHSNGGFMTQRLLCDRTDLFAAGVSLAGSLDPEACSPSRPVSFMQVHGTKDAVISYQGGTVIGGSAAYVSVETTMSTWASKNGCTGQRAGTADALDLVTDLAGAESHPETYSGCPAGITTKLIRIDNGAHVPAFAKPAWPETIWAFLSSASAP